MLQKMAYSSELPEITPLILPFFTSSEISLPTFNASIEIFPLFVLSKTSPVRVSEAMEIASFVVEILKFSEAHPAPAAIFF